LFRPDEAAARLYPQVRAIRAAALELPDSLRGPRVIFLATLHPNFLAATHYPQPLFRYADLEPVGSQAAYGERRTLKGAIPDELTKAVFLAASDNGLARLEDLLSPRNAPASTTAWAEVRKFAAMRLQTRDELIHVPDEADAERVITWEAVLHQPAWGNNAERRSAIDEVYEKWTTLIRELGGSRAILPLYRNEIDDVTFVPVRLPLGLAREAARFNPLRILRPMPELRLRTGHSAHQPILLPLSPTFSQPDPAPQTDARIALFDGGIERSCPFVGSFTNVQPPLSQATPQRHEVEHGHAVTAMVLYGYREPGETLPPPIAAVDHYPVLPAETDDEEDPWNVDLLRVLAHIRDVISSSRYQLVNLSLGPRLPIQDNDAPHVWTAELDRLSRERGVLFVSAVGNNGGEDAESGGNRVQPPGDAVNVLAVGACAHRTAKRYERSPESAVGPGRHGGRVRPLCVAFGGGGVEPMYVLRPHGDWECDHGTSFAAPLVTHSLAGLIGALGSDRCDPATLRAFAIHHARRSTRGHAIHELGYGRIPEDLTTVLDCPPNTVTLLFRDEIRRNEVHGQRLPIPTGLPADQVVQIRLTLCYVGMTDTADAVDYTTSGLELRFRPHSRRFRFTDRHTREQIGELDLELDAEQIAALDHETVKQSRRPVSHPIRRRGSEQQRRTAGKWETTIVGQVSAITAEELFEPMLEVAYFARRRGHLLSHDVAPTLPYTLLVTVSAPGFPLYERVQSSFEAYTPVQVVQEIEI
jgi:hypothetical protein